MPKKKHHKQKKQKREEKRLVSAATTTHRGHEDVKAIVTTHKALEDVRDREANLRANLLPPEKPNVVIGTLNVFGDGARAVGQGFRTVCDPVLKVCYPVVEKAGLATKRAVLDPVKRVCYPPLIAHWERKYKQPHGDKAPWVLLFDLVLLFVLGGLVVTLMFVKFVLPGIPLPDVVQLRLDVPDTVVSGAPTEVRIHYSNDSKRVLADAVLRIELPEQFLFSSSAPAGTAPDGAAMDPRGRFLVIPIGDVAPRGAGDVTVDGVAYGPPGSSHAVASELVYWTEGGIAPEREAAIHDVVVSDSPFSLDLAFDEPFLRGTRNAVRVNYANNGDRSIEGAQVRLSVPPGFVMSGAVPTTVEPGTWNLGTIGPGENGVVTLYGTLPEGAVASFVVRGYENDDADRILVQESHGDVDARSTGFTLGNDIGLPNVLRTGTTAMIRVRYRNAGDRALEHVRVRLETDGRYLDRVPSDWFGGELDRIEPGANGVLTVPITVKSAIRPEDLGADETPVLRIRAVAEYAVEGEPTRVLTADSGESDAMIVTDVGLEGAALYRTKDGEQLGIGPLPPQVGETTKFWIVLKLTNGSGAVHSGRLEATLPPGVRWTGKYSISAGEPIAYLPEYRKLIWNVGTIPAFSDGQDAGASVELAYTPSAEEVGTVPALMRDVRLIATDDATDVRVHATVPDVTTAVRYGTDAEKKGVVQDEAVK